VTTLALLMPVGADWYAVDMPSVREVVASPPLTAVPTAPAALVGLFNLRGEIVPLFDTAELLGIGRVAAGSFVVVVITDLGPAALAATGPPEVVELDDPLPTDMGAGVASYAIDSRLATMIDVDVLLGPDPIGGGGAVTSPPLDLR